MELCKYIAGVTSPIDSPSTRPRSLLPLAFRTLSSLIYSLNSSSSLSALMGLPIYELVTEGAVVATDQPFQSQCNLCALECTLSALQDVLSGIDIAVSDLQVYQEAARKIVVVANQHSQLQLIEGVKSMQLLREFLVALNPNPGRLTAAKQSGNCEVHRASHRAPNWWKKVPVSGSKRGTRHHFDGFCLSQVLEGPPKKFKQLGHQLHNTEIKTWPNESVDGGSDLDCQNSSVDESSCSKSLKAKSLCINDMTPIPSFDSESGNEVWRTFTSAILSTPFGAVSDLRVVRWFSKEKQAVSAKTRVAVLCKTAAVTGWESLSNDLQANVLQRVEFRDLYRFKAVSKSCKKFVESETFRQSLGGITEGSFTAINYHIKNNAWRCSGFDLHSQSWRALPTFSCLPAPDAELFKEYSVCGHGGLMCAEVSKLPKKGELVVFNPLTGEKRALPPLLYPRNLVLVHLLVNSAKRSFKVIVAGSSTTSDGHLSKKMEVFDSSTSEWKEACDLPGPAFGLNEHQAGVCVNGKLLFISFLEGDCRRGVVAFDVENGEWLQDMACPIPFSSYSNILQLVENDGKVYLFSEQEQGASVEHCIDELEFSNPKAGVLACRWRNVVQVKKSGGRGLLVYPEHTCVGFGEGKLCIFNTLNRDGVVYDMRDGKQCGVLEPPPANQKGDNFFSLNPASFILQPNFANITRTLVSEC